MKNNNIAFGTNIINLDLIKSMQFGIHPDFDNISRDSCLYYVIHIFTTDSDKETTVCGNHNDLCKFLYEISERGIIEIEHIDQYIQNIEDSAKDVYNYINKIQNK